MAVDTENKRRSATGMHTFYTIPPKPDSTIDENDREQTTYLYSGLGAASPAAGYFVPRGLLMGVYRQKWIA